MKWLAPTVRVLAWTGLLAFGVTNIVTLPIAQIANQLGGLPMNVLTEFLSGTIERMIKRGPARRSNLEFRAIHESVFEAIVRGEQTGSIPRILDLSDQVRKSAGSAAATWDAMLDEIGASPNSTLLATGSLEPNQSDLVELIGHLYPAVRGEVLSIVSADVLTHFERKFIELLSRDDRQQEYRQKLFSAVLEMHRDLMAKLEAIHTDVKESRGELGEIRELLVGKIAIDTNAPESRQEAQKLYNEAIEIIQGQTPGDAIPLLSQALKLDHSFFDAFMARAVAYMNVRDYASALSDLDRALTIRSGDSMALWIRSMARESRKDAQGAVEDAMQAVRHDPSNASYHLRLGNSLAVADRNIEAAEAYSTALKLSPNSAEARQGLATVIEDRDRMMILLREAVALKPNWGRAHLDLGLTHLKFDNVEEAQREFHRAVELDPTLGQAWTQIARHAGKTQGREVAEELFKKAIEADPELFHSYGSLGAMRFEYEDYHGAIEMFDQAIQRQSHPAVYSLRGLSKEKIGDDQGAIDDYSIEIHLRPEDGDAYYNRGKVYRRHDMHVDALKDLDKAIELSPDHFEARIERARSRIGTGNFDGALSDCAKAIELQPDHFEGYFRRARVYDEMGDLARAEAEYRSLLEKWPDASFYNNLGMLLMRQGRFSESIESLNRAIEEGMGPIALVNRAIAMVESGQSQKAAEDVRKAIAENPAWQSQMQVDPAYSRLMRDPTTRAAIG